MTHYHHDYIADNAARRARAAAEARADMFLILTRDMTASERRAVAVDRHCCRFCGSGTPIAGEVCQSCRDEHWGDD